MKEVLELSRAHTQCVPCTCCSASNVDDLYQASYAHEHKARGLQWARLMGVATMANKTMLFVMLVGRILNDLKHT